MKYSIYFKWIKDNFEDSVIVEKLDGLYNNLNSIKNDNDKIIINVCKIYKNGEYVDYNNQKISSYVMKEYGEVIK